ncbi:MAG: 2-oxoglutarate and iron-dependent oxygenase domain-containing protein [Hyphomicrobiaceae bacterium]
MFCIATVSYTEFGAPEAFVKSLRETGFAVLTDHPIAPERIAETYARWGDFFYSEANSDWIANPERQDGYFPFRSENAKDSKTKDLREFYHVYPNGRLPPALEPETRSMFDDLVDIGRTLLTWIQDNSSANVTDRFTEPRGKSRQEGDRRAFFNADVSASPT